METKITATKKVRKQATLGLSKPKGATTIDVAYVTVTRGKLKIELSFSKYNTELEWYLDMSLTNGLPDFNHGEGSRCCLKKVAKELVLDAIEKAELIDDSVEA